MGLRNRVLELQVLEPLNQTCNGNNNNEILKCGFIIVRVMKSLIPVVMAGKKGNDDELLNY